MTDTIAPTLVETICQRLAAGRRVRRTLPDGGRLHIDRPLPFLVVYRRPVGRPDPGTGQLALGEASYLVAPAGESLEAPLAGLVVAVVGTLAARFNAFLLLELWAGQPETGAGGTARATFHLHLPPGEAVPRPTVAALVRGLRAVPLLSGNAAVELHQGGHAPPGMPPLLTTDHAGRHACLMLGLEVPPVYRDPQTLAVYPRMLSVLHRGLSRAMQQAFFTFTRVQTRATVEHYQALGRRAVVRAVWEVDARLAEIDDAFDFLLAVTPVNAPAALAEFKACGFAREPALHYRLLAIDPDLLKRRLYEIPIERVEDPALGELFRAKRAELDRQITMLEDRETRLFFYGSMQLYGGVDDELLGLAERLLSVLPPRHVADRGACTDAAEFARRARDEIEAYRRDHDAMTAQVEVRGDVPGLLVSDGTLLVGQDLRLSPDRVEPLIAHEVGTHLLTYFNGRAQPLRLLHCGLAGYEELQEGIAVLSEWLVGGLDRGRLRLLAARVVAARRLQEGAAFPRAFSELHEAHGFSPGLAFNVTMRIFRGGGLTKDAIYLRGLVQLLKHLREGGDLEELLIGKISLASLPLVRELRWREVLRPPPVRPHHLRAPTAAAKLRRLREGLTVTDLVASASKDEADGEDA